MYREVKNVFADSRRKDSLPTYPTYLQYAFPWPLMTSRSNEFFWDTCSGSFHPSTRNSPSSSESSASIHKYVVGISLVSLSPDAAGVGDRGGSNGQSPADCFFADSDWFFGQKNGKKKRKTAEREERESDTHRERERARKRRRGQDGVAHRKGGAGKAERGRERGAVGEVGEGGVHPRAFHRSRLAGEGVVNHEL